MDSVNNSVLSSTAVRPLRRAFVAWIMWSMTASFVLFQFFLQLSSGAIIHGLMNSFSIGAFGGSLLASAYYYIYVALQTPVGQLIDRFGPRRLLSVGAIVCALGCLLFGSSHILFFAALGRLMMGSGAAFAWVGSMYIIARWFPPARFGLMVGFAEAIGMIGTVMGSYFLATTIQNLGWRESMLGASVILALIGAMIAVFVRNAPANAEPIIVDQRSLKSDLKILLKNKYAWINGLYSGLMFAILSVFVALWAIPFIELTHRIHLVMATVVCNLVFLGGLVGGPLASWLDSMIRSRRVLLAVGALGSAITLSLLIYFPQIPLGFVIGLMILLGLFSGAYVLTFSIGNEIVPPHIRGTSMGFVNTLSMITAPLLQPLIGFILHVVSHETAGKEYYSVANYQVALSVMPILLVIAAILTKWIPLRKLDL